MLLCPTQQYGPCSSQQKKEKQKKLDVGGRGYNCRAQEERKTCFENFLHELIKMSPKA